MTAPTRMKTLILPGARTCTLSTSHPSTMLPTYTPGGLAAVHPLCALCDRDGCEPYEVRERELLSPQTRVEAGCLEGGGCRGRVSGHWRERLTQRLASLLERRVHEGERAQPQG